MSITYETRREAFERVDAQTMESKVLWVLTTKGPMSAEQIMHVLGTSNPNNVRPRLTGLSKKGKIRAVGKRKNDAGHNEAVWEIAV